MIDYQAYSPNYLFKQTLVDKKLDLIHIHEVQNGYTDIKHPYFELSLCKKCFFPKEI